MNAKSIIRRTRDGEALTRDEIRYLVRGAAHGDVEPYQLTAWMMAVFLRGFSPEQTAVLTQEMLDSGDRLEFSGAAYPPADKHSTGGVGDKISFLVAPLVAAAGVPVPMISGRSLGHTGGTLDKLESIPGCRTRLSTEEFVRQVEAVGLCIAGQTERLAPADRVLYQLRDAASIVESVPLITASILSKKGAAGVRALALDVKLGDGAFMPDRENAVALARSLVETAGRLGIRARALLTRMDRVLGRTAGNALEIAEVARALRGEAAPDLRELTLELGATMCRLSGRVRDEAEGRALLTRLWDAGDGFERFARMVSAQGGDARCLEDPGLLPRARASLEVAAVESGLFLGVRARPAGEWLTEAGGGRLRAKDKVDPRVGIESLRRAGEKIVAGEPVLRLHLPEAGPFSEAARDGAARAALRQRATGWIQLAAAPVPGPSEEPEDDRIIVEAVDPA